VNREAMTMMRVSRHSLAAFSSALLEGAGMSAARAQQVTDVLVWADLRGVGTHGVSRLPLYLRWLGSGEMNKNPTLSIARSTSCLSVLDADRAPGAVAMLKAVDLAAVLARTSGVGMVLVRGTTHTGALGYYSSALARHGLAGIAFVASGPNMIYHGAAAAGVSTAPLTMAVPRGAADPVVFDMASSVISVGQLAQARRLEQELPEGSAADGRGKPTRDPHAAVATLPLGGPKGSGLALMAEFFCSVLAGAPILVPALASAPQAHRQNAMVLALDPAHFGDVASFDAQVEELATAVKTLPAVDGEILLPGERGTREQRKHEAHGIPLPHPVVEELNEAAARLGVPFLN